jgi:hypothetical protein
VVDLMVLMCATTEVRDKSLDSTTEEEISEKLEGYNNGGRETRDEGFEF